MEKKKKKKKKPPPRKDKNINIPNKKYIITKYSHINI
jgi:hypothetical protein